MFAEGHKDDVWSLDQIDTLSLMVPNTQRPAAIAGHEAGVVFTDACRSILAPNGVTMTKKNAFQASPTNPNLQEIQTEPERRVDMPYAPAMRVESPCGLLFISGATPSPLYHKHPHVLSEHDHPNRIEDQTRRAMETIKTILEHQGLTWTDVVKVTKYLTDIRDQDGMVAVLKEYFGSWTPASTTICINQLSTPGARIELDMIAAYPPGK